MSLIHLPIASSTIYLVPKPHFHIFNRKIILSWVNIAQHFSLVIYLWAFRLVLYFGLLELQIIFKLGLTYSKDKLGVVVLNHMVFIVLKIVLSPTFGTVWDPPKFLGLGGASKSRATKEPMALYMWGHVLYHFNYIPRTFYFNFSMELLYL